MEDYQTNILPFKYQDYEFTLNVPDNIYVITQTNPDDVVTTFLGHFSYQGQDYALITFLDAPKGIKSTYNFNSAGWNATELARKIVESIVLNANLAKQN